MEDIRKVCPYNEENCADVVCPCPKYKAYEAVNNPEILNDKLKEINLDLDTDTFELFINIQKKLTTKFHPLQLSKIEKDHWINAYLVCIEDETREIREYLNVYPDKEAIHNNKAELKKEIIDILHFVLEVFIAGDISCKAIKDEYIKQFINSKGHNLGEIEINYIDLLRYAFMFQKKEFDDVYGSMNIDQAVLLLSCKLLDCNGAIRQQISWKHWKKPSDTINEDKLTEQYAKLFKILVDLFVSCMDSIDEIKEIYIKKNIENVLRQEFGY